MLALRIVLVMPEKHHEILLSTSIESRIVGGTSQDHRAYRSTTRNNIIDGRYVFAIMFASGGKKTRIIVIPRTHMLHKLREFVTRMWKPSCRSLSYKGGRNRTARTYDTDMLVRLIVVHVTQRRDR